MKEIRVLVSDEAKEAISQIGDHKLPGRVWFESYNGKKYLRFEPYRRRTAQSVSIVLCIVLPEGNHIVEPLNPEENGKI